MSRLPFDPKKMPPREAGEPARRERERYGEFEADRPLSVTQVTDLIKRVLADRTPAPVRVVGEVSNFSDRRHWYLSLKDEENVLACVMWASAAGKAGFTPQRGQQVVATGRLDYFGPQGRLQMYIDRLEPVGQGVLELKYRELCEELRKAGYFDDARKRPLPAFPRHLAVVTSVKGAAVADVIRTARNRMPGIALTVVDVRVQGASAAPDVAAAIRMIDERHAELGIDAVVLTRGGGSLEDLWAFNERQVADAVHACHVPIVAAIGHETDTTIAELVADLRCSTPTQAVERLVPDAATERQRIEQLAGRLAASLRRRIDHARTRVNARANHPMFRRPTATIDLYRDRVATLERHLTQSMRQRIADDRHLIGELRHDLAKLEPMGRLRVARGRIDEAGRRLSGALAQRLAAERAKLESITQVLEAVSPQRVLERGYSLTTDGAGRVVRSVTDVTPGAALRTRVTDGEIESTVDGGTTEVKPRQVPKAPKEPSQPAPEPDADGMPSNLFE